MIVEGWRKFLTDAQQKKPRVYYHVASVDHEEDIKAHGIYGSTQAGDRDYAYSEEDAEEKRVYLFSSQDSAYMAAFSRPDSGIFGDAEPPFIFVKIDLAKVTPLPEIHDDLELLDYDAYYLVGDIPANAIIEIESEAEATDKVKDDEDYYDYDILREAGEAGEAEEIEKLRVFEVELVIKISRQAGIDDTLADIRSVPGVTIVTPLESNRSGGGATSTVRIKFHPSKEAMTGQTYVKQILIPTVNSAEIPGCIVLRFVPRSLRLI